MCSFWLTKVARDKSWLVFSVLFFIIIYIELLSRKPTSLWENQQTIWCIPNSWYLDHPIDILFFNAKLFAGKQEEKIDPILDWVHKEFGFKPELHYSFFGGKQGDGLVKAVEDCLKKTNDCELAAIDAIAAAAHSLVISLAIFRGRLGIEEAIELIRLEEDLQVTVSTRFFCSLKDRKFANFCYCFLAYHILIILNVFFSGWQMGSSWRWSWCWNCWPPGANIVSCCVSGIVMQTISFFLPVFLLEGKGFKELKLLAGIWFVLIISIIYVIIIISC